jgi:hypothetical protein
MIFIVSAHTLPLDKDLLAWISYIISWLHAHKSFVMRSGRGIKVVFGFVTQVNRRGFILLNQSLRMSAQGIITCGASSAYGTYQL